MTNSTIEKPQLKLTVKPQRDAYVGFKLTDAERDSLNRYAWAYHRSVSEIIREALMTLSIIPEGEAG